MCGIIGYIGDRQVIPVLLEGLRRLEYRGYDSAGVVFFEKNEIKVIKTKGKILNLEEKLFKPFPSKAKAPGLGHTRWATHGEPSDENAHPHFDCHKSFALVHNGIIENYYELKTKLLAKGHRFVSATDTEVIVHLIEDFLNQGLSLKQAFFKALRTLKGAYAVALIHKNHPDLILVGRNQSPVVIGLGNQENFIASDIPALLPFTKEVLFLNDGEVAIVSKDKVEIYDLSENPVLREPYHVTWDIASAEKGGFAHFMLKEIYEQPDAVKNTMLERIDLDKNQVDFSKEGLTADFFKDIQRFYLVACGTSYHAGLVAKYLIERELKIPVEVDIASEFRYRDPVINEKTLFIGISQSGETADTLASLRLAKSKGAKTLSICNVVGSTIARESKIVLYTKAGPEISVASTKAFSTQVLIFVLLTIYLKQILFKENEKGKKIESLIKLPSQLKLFIEKVHPKIKLLAQNYYQASNVLYLGRNILYPIALEGALKLKEISYIHAEGYAAGEMKHGPIALIEEKVPTIILAAKETGIVYEKTLSNAEEVKSRRGPIISLITEGAEEFQKISDEYIEVPLTFYEFLPIFYVVPLQLLAYEIATLRGCDVDKPRNLAKSVTVE
ncbi:glutamine--fructose-6-phosphate transaminase (isomerizing) [Thermodesulfobacterium sp. TA1]|uniref:glutamine--fructose-6-phosphate transaminase (isomerizing) n=1 Tax=Thermodesulfobacterium sp. TA1 TaxID=2234087 RepID=UPI001232B52F|nr:glutamine--fructose-6-phosphate transaminase (isomerizing) [Thermodesulfobacterium sp. TA1]QER41960.1 glutamine--fructose-6-phosphate transaminase (isomerizing) [Thermodesulfobacterium sp. TA1]